MAADMINDSQLLTMATVDCTAEIAFCAIHDVVSYPAIRIFRGNLSTVVRYRGIRRALA